MGAPSRSSGRLSYNELCQPVSGRGSEIFLGEASGAAEGPSALGVKLYEQDVRRQKTAETSYRPPGGFMRRVADIVGVAITLEVGSEQTLFILLSDDGTVNRMGTGSAGNTDRDLFIGRTLDPLLPSLLRHLTDDMLRHTGGYDVPDKRGVPSRLSIALKFANGEEDGFGFEYGTESQGLPLDISAFVQAALAITDPWFAGQMAMVQSASKRADAKPWWRFW
jgi:hypothetical protein